MTGVLPALGLSSLSVTEVLTILGQDDLRMTGVLPALGHATLTATMRPAVVLNGASGATKNPIPREELSF
jgi:hypothetical protein